MTQKEIIALPWYGEEKFALVNIDNKNIFFASDDKQLCIDTKIRMTPKHPLYSKLKLIEKIT